VSRNAAHFGRVRAVSREVLDRATALGAAFRERNEEGAAQKIGLLERRMGNLCALAEKLGSNAPGMDASTLTKINAEWKIIRRLVDGLQGPVAVHDMLVELRTDVQHLEDYLQKLTG